MLEAYIAKEFAKTVLETIKRFAKEKAVPEETIQVYFGLDEEGENVYRICHNYQPYKTVGFLDNGILKGRMDFAGKSAYVPPAINQILHAVAIENGMAVTQAGIMIFKKDTDSFPVGIYLYNGTQPVRPATFDELFSKIKLA